MRGIAGLILLLGSSHCLIYLGGNLNWLYHIEKPNRVIFKWNIHWKVEDDTEYDVCITAQTVPRMPVTPVIDLALAGPLRNEMLMKCKKNKRRGYISVYGYKVHQYNDLTQHDAIIMTGPNVPKSTKMWRLRTDVKFHHFPAGASGLFSTIDSPPAVATSPLMDLCQMEIDLGIYALDVDFDTQAAKCRWSSGKDECGDFCISAADQSLFSLTNNCELTFLGTGLGSAVMRDVLLTITVEDKSLHGNLLPTVAATHVQFTASLFGIRCRNDIKFSSVVTKKVVERDLANCAGMVEFKFEIHSVGNEALQNVQVTSGPPDATLTMISKDTANNKAEWLFSWRATSNDRGTHTICVSSTSYWKTQQGCFLLIVYDSSHLDPSTLISKLPKPTKICDSRPSCETIKSCSSPVTTTQIPVTTTQIPVTATQILVTTTQIPVTTTQIPVTTTQIPVTTTQIPMTTTQIPVTTTQIRVTTTQIPVTTTQIPVTTTQIPVTVTQIPPKAPDIIPVSSRSGQSAQNYNANIPAKTVHTNTPEYVVKGPEPWVAGIPLGILLLLALIFLIVAILYRKKQKKDEEVAKSTVEDYGDDDLLPDEEYSHHRMKQRPSVQLRRFSNISDIMPNAIPTPKSTGDPLPMPSQRRLNLFPTARTVDYIREESET